MPRAYTPRLRLLMVDPDEQITRQDLQRIFQVDVSAIDASVLALEDRIQALANAGHTPVSPVVVSGNALKVRIENASTLFDIPALLAPLPNYTPVRITGFTIAMTSVQDVVNFFERLDTLFGIDAGDGVVNKAQMHGTVRVSGGDASNPLTVSGAQISSWNARYPSVTVIPERVESHVYYYTFDGAELLYDETVYDGADASYGAAVPRASGESGYMLSFIGWSTEGNSSDADADLQSVTEDLTVYAAYQRLRDIAPTLSVQFTNAPGETAEIAVENWGSYSKVAGAFATDINGETVTNDFRLSGDTITLTPTASYLACTEWSLSFSDRSGSCLRDVPFRLRDVPVILGVSKLASALSLEAAIQVEMREYNAGVEFTCAYRSAAGSGTNQTMALSLGNGITVSGTALTITPATYPKYNLSNQRLTFTNAAGDTAVFAVNVFSS